MNNATGPIQQTCQVQISKNLTLEGNLSIPAAARGIVLFAHGSGSGRHSPRNRFVAGVLQKAGIATLLFDLLTEHEEQEDQRTGHLRFDIRLLSERVIGATDWLLNNPQTANLKIGYFGASTGAAAALVAAAQRPMAVGAVVSRGGRPDLASTYLEDVKAPVLLLIGAKDTQVIELNQMAYALLKGEKHIKIIPGASHLFEEPGTLEQVALEASEWFIRYLVAT